MKGFSLHNNDRGISVCGGNFDSGEKEIGDNFGFAHYNFISTHQRNNNSNSNNNKGRNNVNLDHNCEEEQAWTFRIFPLKMVRDTDRN